MPPKVHRLFADLVDLRHPPAACGTCELRDLWCLPIGLSGNEFHQLGNIITRRKRLKRGEHLYRAGDAFRSLYAVRTGFFKTQFISSNGQERVTGFHMTGELLGLDAISSENQGCHAIALEDSEVCEIPYAALESLCREIPALQKQFLKIMSGEISRDQKLIVLLSTMNADERLAAFLLNLSQRFGARGYSPNEFQLRMTRGEIGSYLGLKLETISRTLSKFQEDGLIGVKNKHLTLTDLARLKQILECSRSTGAVTRI